MSWSDADFAEPAMNFESYEYSKLGFVNQCPVTVSFQNESPRPRIDEFTGDGCASIRMKEERRFSDSIAKSLLGSSEIDLSGILTLGLDESRTS